MKSVESMREEAKPANGLEHVDLQKKDETGMSFDPHGMLLIPQPTDRSDDPLVFYMTNSVLTLDMGKIS
jgi:hypothetical protein